MLNQSRKGKRLVQGFGIKIKMNSKYFSITIKKFNQFAIMIYKLRNKLEIIW